MVEHRQEPDPTASSQSDGAETALVATRELLWVETPDDVRALAVRLVETLGGRVVPAMGADDGALPVDVSFGGERPLLPSAPTTSDAHATLARHLPPFVRAAHRALELVGRAERLVEEAEIDMLTGLPTRRRVGRVLGRLEPGDVVLMLDLDEFKQLNDRLGHGEGDRVLRAFGRVLQETLRARDEAGRFGGEEFVVVLLGGHAAGADEEPIADDAAVEALLARLRAAWEADRPHAVTFSAGIARVGTPTSAALPAADAAMYEAKRAGRDRWLWAHEVVAP